MITVACIRDILLSCKTALAPYYLTEASEGANLFCSINNSFGLLLPESSLQTCGTISSQLGSCGCSKQLACTHQNTVNKLQLAGTTNFEKHDAVYLTALSSCFLALALLTLALPAGAALFVCMSCAYRS